MTVAGSPSVTVARTEAEVEDLRERWRRLQGDNFNTDTDYFLAVLRSDPRTPSPYVILVETDGAPAALAVGRLDERRLPHRIGYKTVYAPRVRTLTIVYGGFLGADLAAQAGALVDELRAALARRDATAISLPNLPRSSPLFDALARDGGRGHVGATKAHWRLELPGSLEDFIAGKPSRSRGRIRRYPKRFLEAYGDRHRLEVFRDASELDRLFADTEKVAARTYQRGLGTAFTDDDFSRSLTRFAMEQGWFRGYVLYVDDEPRAYWYGSAYAGIFRTGVTGYDPEFSEYHLGTYLLMRMIEDLCADPAVRAIDYGFGDAEYKHTFGTESWEEVDVLVFGPTLRGAWLGLTRGAVHGLDSTARRLAGGALAARTKRAWRRRLRARDA